MKSNQIRLHKTCPTLALLVLALASPACSVKSAAQIETQTDTAPVSTSATTEVVAARLETQPKAPTEIYSVDQLTGMGSFADMATDAPASGATGACAASANRIKPKRRLRTEALVKFREMAAQLCRDTGLSISLFSDNRTAAEQRSIWAGKRASAGAMAAERGCTLAPSGAARERSIATCILKYNSMPGSSRHHWGSDVDINSAENSYWNGATGKKIKTWLDANAEKYGFCQPYAGKAAGLRKAGYNDEAWHWSYMPFAADMLTEYVARVSDKDIVAALGGAASGLKEADVAALRIRQDYVGTIAAKCLNWPPQ